jgi:hypothetical protein
MLHAMWDILYDFQPPSTLKASDQVPKFQHKVDKAKFHEEIRNKSLTIEDVVALAPKISTSDDDDRAGKCQLVKINAWLHLDRRCRGLD